MTMIRCPHCGSPVRIRGQRELQQKLLVLRDEHPCPHDPVQLD